MGSVAQTALAKPFKAVRKPGAPITVQEFQPTDTPWPLNVAAREDGSGHFVKNGVHSSEINIKPGDLIRIDDPNDTYPIDIGYFNANFDKLID